MEAIENIIDFRKALQLAKEGDATGMYRLGDFVMTKARAWHRIKAKP